MGLFRSTVDSIKKGLSKTRAVLNTDVRVLLRGQVLTDSLIDQLEAKLIQADIGVPTVVKLIEAIREAYKKGTMQSGDDAWSYMKKYLADFWPEADRKLNFAESGPTVILVSGINGAGKTTSIAKIAKQLRDADKTVLLAACDTFRAGAVKQLEIWSERLGVEIVKGQEGGKPSAVAWDAAEAALARDVDVLLVDTAGRLHTQKHLMDELIKIRNVIEKKIPGSPHEVLLVLDATTGQNAIRQAKEFGQAIDVTGIFLAKLDGTAKGGIVVAIREQLDLPVKFIGVGETPDDVEPFEPEKFVEALFAE